ncbi:hypothetical protein LCGC14_1279130 [marine sediment metagenome]|uniref:C2H2-type domain-containing protein n=1 Tax=marine sediment metagenome TaxID=412755 RepID=A0A0F9KVQ4_9ZZZZ
MRVRRVNRYYCDFCGKGGCAGGHMKKHEAHCTLNPNRICRFCKRADLGQHTDIPALVLTMPDPKKHLITHRDKYTGEWTTLEITEAANAALPLLRENTTNCPACIMAVLRLAKIPVPAVTDFKFNDEVKAFWQQINEDDEEHSEFG